jgi:hypothetical protein
MAASPVKDLYNSPNGDRWVLCRNPSGMLVVSHHPNSASGGRISETGVDVFLAQNGRGPEREALVEALARLGACDSSPKEVEQLSRTLGQAVTQCWSGLPQEIQQDLFEAAVTSEGETIRQRLAVFLHGKHERPI